METTVSLTRAVYSKFTEVQYPGSNVNLPDFLNDRARQTPLIF